MLKDCLEIFEAELERTKKRFGDSDRLILDEYILADGDYLVVEKNGEIRQCSVRMDKKTRTVERIPVDDKLYERICFYDYHSRLVSMDKPQDTKKVIHSNSYKYFLKKKFLYRNVIGAEDREGKYKEYVNRQGLQEIVNEVFYSKWLTGNYFTPEDEMSIDGELKRILIWSREAVFAWLYKGREVGMDRILHTVAKNVIKESIKNGYMGKVVQQFNLMCSFDEYFGGCNMADRYSEIREKLRDKINCRGEQIIESDEEYFYAVGQLVGYYISLSKAKEKTHSLANPFFNATSNEVLQTRLKQYFMKYNHEIATRSSRFNYMYGMVLGYELEGKIRQEPIIAGYLSNSLFYESSKKEMEET